jgi:hypothetical protein
MNSAGTVFARIAAMRGAQKPPTDTWLIAGGRNRDIAAPFSDGMDTFTVIAIDLSD